MGINVSIGNVADLANCSIVVSNIREHKVAFLVDPALLVCDLLIVN